MSDVDADVEVITSPRKVANLRRLSAIRHNARRRMSAIATAPVQPTLRRIAGQKQAMLAFSKKKPTSLKVPASSSALKFRPMGKAIPKGNASAGPSKSAPALPNMSSSDEDEDEEVEIPWHSPAEEDTAVPKKTVSAAKIKEVIAAAKLNKLIEDSQHSDVDDDINDRDGGEEEGVPVAPYSDEEDNAEEINQRKAEKDKHELRALLQETNRQKVEKGRRELRALLRGHRPILTNYRLGAAIMYIPIQSAVEMGEIPGWYKPPEEAFLHAEVISLLQKNGLEHIRDNFEAIGVYMHADVVKLSLEVQGLDGWRWKMHLMHALELLPQSVDWHRLLNVLSEYVRPS